VLLRHGHWSQARRSLAAGKALVSGITTALPWLAVQVRLELVAGFVMLRDSAAARVLLDEVDEIFARHPDLGRLGEQRDRLQAEVADMPSPDDGRTPLTGAELRLLPLLATHLSFREIGALFFLSRHTVKTQAMSAYRKLGASSRSEAVQRAEQLGLIDPAADAARALIPTG
jgi:LuxR family maltose regulon positive regulatory protein